MEKELRAGPLEEFRQQSSVGWAAQGEFGMS